MKKTIKKTVSEYLRILTRIKAKRCHKNIIGITGSIGKTSSKKAIVEVLSSKFKVDQTSGNYNTDFGLMLSVLRQQSGGSSPLGWITSIAGAAHNFLTDNEKFDHLVLEMGVDKPGDMTDILKILTPDISIFTGVSPVHLNEEQYKDEQEIFKEKAKIVRTLKKGTAIINYDNQFTRQLEKEKLNCQTLWYGVLDKNTDLHQRPPGVYAAKIKSSHRGLTAHIHDNINPGNSHDRTITIPILGEQHIYIVLPAITIGLLHGMNLKEISTALQKFNLPPGRMNPLPGINRSTIIDSSYNASPATVESALKTLWSHQSQRKIAVLGTMNELGDHSERAHRDIGQIIPQYAQMLITVGDEAKYFAKEAATHGMPQHLIHSFKTAKEAGKYLQNTLRHDDVVLVKGSQNNVHLENCIKMIMLEPDRAGELLVRQKN